MTAGIDRAREDLAAALLLADGGFAAQAVGAAFRAGLRAAEDALLLLGRAPAPPEGLVTAFVRHVVQERGLDPATGRRLRSLANRYALTDMATTPTSAASTAIADATAVVDVLGRWIDDSIRVAQERAAARTGRPAPRAVKRRR